MRTLFLALGMLGAVVGLGGCGCAAKPGAAGFVREWDQVGIEERLVLGTTNFADVIGFSEGFHMEAIDNFTLNLILQATQAAARTLTFTQPRVVFPLPGSRTCQIDGFFKFDVAVQETGDHQLAIDIQKIEPVGGRDPSFPRGKVVIPSTPLKQLVLPNSGNAVLLGISLDHPKEPYYVLLLLRVKAFRSKEVGDDLFGKEYDRAAATKPAK